MLHIHRSERADRLAAALAGILADPLEDPFAAEVVAVPTRGVERWLAQTLAAHLGAQSGRGDGICANVEFPFPGRILTAALATATGLDPDADPWPAERSVWPLLAVFDESLEEPFMAELRAHLEVPEEAGAPPRRLGLVRHLAGLLEGYEVHRPQTIRAWAAGADPPDPGMAWQAELWRRLRARIGTPSPAERLPGACARLREEPGLLGLPRRLALFGLTRIAAGRLEVLDAIAVHRDVHLFVLHPSPSLWDALAAPGLPTGPLPRAEDVTAGVPANRLMASWGRDVRELQLVLARAGPARHHHHPLGDPPPATLLGRLQADVRADRRPPGAPLPDERDPRPGLDPDDRSVQIHACHGRARQVEVLRDVVLHLLADDPTLEPRDVIVMCPDIETFAPLIQATFGNRPESAPAGPGEAPELRVRLADRALRQTNPLLGALSALLELAGGRVTASGVLDLCDREPVRRRFGLDDDELARLREWVVAGGVRWGLDAEHRRPWRLETVDTNTWRAGLDRILVGVTAAEEGRPPIAGVMPLDDVDSGAIDLAGRVAELLDRLGLAVRRLARPHTAAEWPAALAEAADSLMATAPRQAWQRDELQGILAGLDPRDAGGALAGAPPSRVGLDDVRALLAERLRGRPTRANFRTGHLTVCTLVPMRSVPHRVVCVLGLDDGAFPRRTPRDGDDLTLAEPRIGERDPRSEDRQMLLDALMAARQHLVITYTGNDERTNLPRPPAVPVGELLDVIDGTVGGGDGVVTRHPLQPFDPRNFRPGELVPSAPWSFDRTALAGAVSLAGSRRPPPRFLTDPLPPRAAPVLELPALLRFLDHPARAFLRERIGITLGRPGDAVEDALPVELDGLAEWRVGQRVLEGLLAGGEVNDCLAAERARGALPPFRLAIPLIERVGRQASSLAQAATALAAGAPASLEVNLPLPDGRILAGTVGGVLGDTLLSVSYTRIKPRDRLRAWARLLAAGAAHPERPLHSVVIGRPPPGLRWASVTVASIPVLGADPEDRRQAALGYLLRLVELFDLGMAEPLPLACEASAAYAAAARTGEDGAAAAAGAWGSRWNLPREDVQPEHVLVHGRVVPLAALMEETPRPGEQGPGWEATESSRFGRLSRRLWDDLLARESVESG